MAAQQQVIDYGNTANDGQGDPLRDAFIKVDDNFANIWDAGPVGSNIQIVNNTIGVTNTNGNLILAPNGTGVVQTNNHILPRIDSVYSLGSPNLRFRSAYIGYGGLYVTGNLTIDGTIFGNISLGSPIVADLRGSVIADDGVTVLVNAVSKSLYATSANITGNLSAGNLRGTFLTGTLTTNAQPNITSVGTLSLLNVTGNLSANNISGRITTASQPNITSVGTLSNLAVTGNVTTSGYFVGDGSKLSNLSVTGGTAIINGNSNVTVAANSSVSVSVAGVSNVAVFNTSNVVINGLITATGNVSGTYILGNGAFLTGLPANYGNANVANYLPTYSGNLNSVSAIPGSAVTGSVALANIANVAYSVAGANVSGQVANAAYANISGVSYSVNVANVSGIGNIATINLDGNVANVLRGDGSFAPEGQNLNANYANFAGEAFNVSGANVSGQVANALIAGTVYTNAQPNITSVGNLSNLTVTGNITSSANISGTYILGNGAFLTGLLEAYGNANVANYLPTYSGNLNSVSAIPGSAVTGTVALANIAYSVAGANVSGQVANAAYANISGVAYSVSGANVSGQVANAAYANIAGTAYSVNVANVSGIGNIATINLDGNVANVLRGDGSFAPEGGNLTANYANFAGEAFNVSGANVSGQVANALIAGTVYTNAQPNITSVGTLSDLTVTGNISGGNLISIGNISGNYISGNGTQLTGILGSNADMGPNTAGALISNAVTLTTTTTVTNGIALLNQVLGKLVPPSPPNFPNNTTITLSGIATYRMANITQVDNTPGANRAVAAGTSVANVLRVATYATNTISTVGPGDSGIVTAVRNGANVGNVTLNTGASPTANGIYGGNLVITNNYDYHAANANIAAGFWYVFSAAVSGTTAPAGWNELYIADSATSNTNTTVWYYDNSSPSAPSFSSVTMAPPGSANLLYSSTIPHYTNNNNFTIGFNVANVSGNTYPTSNTLASGSSGGAFAAPSSITYSASNIGSNVLNSFASASANTTASVTTGFGGSSTGPSMSVNNSYSTGTLTLTTALGNTVLWKSGTATAIDEANVVIGSTIGTGSGNAFRIVNPGSGNTPTYTSNAAAFNSQSSTLETYDATVVGSGSAGVLKHDQTNYATGYLPAGPNLSSGRTGTQYFTFKFVRTAVSKFDIRYTGTIAGMWVALPGSVIDSSSSANGWIDMSVAYGGAGYPGVNTPGNGSDGCALGGTVTLNSAVTNSSKTCTFGTISSSSTATNEIYVRIALASGQSVTALTLQTASN